ncbi:hypothetical protein D9M71_546770 [compost metagenome]
MRVVLFLRQLLQVLGQLFFRVAVDVHRALLAEPRGDLVEAGGEGVRRLPDQAVAGVLRQRVAMGAEGGEVAEQRVREHQEAEAELGVLAEMSRLQEHVRQRGGQRRVGVVRVAPGQAVGEVVALAAGVLLHDLAQVAAVAGDAVAEQRVQAAALPVREDQEHRQAGDQRAEQGIEQARQDQPVAVAHLVEAEQHQQGDRRRGQGVARAAGGEEGDPGGHRQ